MNPDEINYKTALEQISKITGDAIKPHPLGCACELCKVHEIARSAITPWTQPDLFSFNGAADFIQKMSETRSNS